MANQVIARLKGDDYQHLWSWYYATDLLVPDTKVVRVCLEDEDAVSVDDVTVHFSDASSLGASYLQIKYHVDHRSAYSSESLIQAEQNKSSLLQKFFRSWKHLKQVHGSRPINLSLLSNWGWDSEDALRPYISGDNQTIKASFLHASPRSAAGKVREKWRAHLSATEEELREFVATLVLRFGSDNTSELVDRVEKRQRQLGLGSDSSALLLAVGLVRDWIKLGATDLNRDALEEVLAKQRFPRAQTEAATVCIDTIKASSGASTPDFALNWCGRFDGPPERRGHTLAPGVDWNRDLFPELAELEKRIVATGKQQIRVSGFSRLSVWFAFGYVFCDVSRYVIEFEQSGRFWRSNSSPSADFQLVRTEEPLGNRAMCEDGPVAIGVSVTGSLDEDVRQYLKTHEPSARHLLLLQPNRPLGRDCLRNENDAVALADCVKDAARQFVKATRATQLLLFYFGPAVGACFIGHRLNAVCRQIHVMEDTQPGYQRTFLLS